MSRVSFFVGVPDGMLDDFLSRVGAKFIAGDVYTSVYEMNDHRVVFGTVRKAVTFSGKTSVASSGKWDIYTVHGNSDDWRWGTKVFRYLKRFALSPQARNASKWRILGPISAAQLSASYPVIAAAILPSGGFSHVISGDDPQYLASIDYNPSDAFVNADTEASEDALFPPGNK